MLALVFAAAMAAPTVPAPDPACIPVPFAIAEAEKVGGHMIDLLPVDGENFDHLLFVVVHGMVQMWGVHDGCMVGRSIPVDIVRDTGQPAYGFGSLLNGLQSGHGFPAPPQVHLRGPPLRESPHGLVGWDSQTHSLPLQRLQRPPGISRSWSCWRVRGATMRNAHRSAAIQRLRVSD